MCLEYIPRILDRVWNYRICLGYYPNNWNCVEYVASILECVWSIYRVYWKWSGMSTEYTGMCLEYIPSTLELCGLSSEYTGVCLEYIPSIQELVWNI